jgi:hypothetical protein
MTSESDSSPRRRPPTIDLKATEVETEKPTPAAQETSEPSNGRPNEEAQPAGDQSSTPPPSPGGARAHAGAQVFSAMIGALAMLVIVGGLWAADVIHGDRAVPERAPPQTTAPAQALATAPEISTRLDKIEAAIAGQRPDPGLPARVGTIEAETKSVADSLAALNRRIDQIAVTARDALGRADNAAATGETAKNAAQQAAGLQRGDLDALTNRIAALERGLKALSDEVARRPTSADDRVARAMVAADALRAAVARGAPFEDELAAAKATGIEEQMLAPLEPFAADGVPSAAALAGELSALIPALRQASGDTTTTDTSLWGRLEAHVQKLVRVTPAEAPPGNDPDAIVARINAAAAHGDIRAALADLAKLPDEARTAAADWIKKAQAREAALAASHRVAAAALAALGKPATQ